MRILLLAYLCAPGQGSEPGIGWNWAVAAVRLGHEVTVITRSKSQNAIVQEQRRSADAAKIDFHFIDDNEAVEHFFDENALFRMNKALMYYRYRLWQKAAAEKTYGLCRRNEREYDLIHAVTISGIRFPCFVQADGTPLLIGPLGGGETVPWRLLWSFPVRGILSEALRFLSIASLRINPDMRLTFRRAQAIATTSHEAAHWIPKEWRVKTFVRLNVASDYTAEFNSGGASPPTDDASFKVLYAGRFVHWKGMHLGLRAFAGLAASRAGVQLTMIGGGPAEGRWRALAAQLRIDEKVIWRTWQARSEVLRAYCDHDAFLYPSLRDPSPWAVVEALAAGLPIVCCNLGGPGQLVTSDCGLVIAAKTNGASELIQALTRALLLLYDDPEKRRVMQTNARRRARSLTWERTVQDTYAAYRSKMTPYVGPGETAGTRGAGTGHHTADHRGADDNLSAFSCSRSSP